MPGLLSLIFTRTLSRQSLTTCSISEKEAVRTDSMYNRPRKRIETCLYTF